MDQVTNTDLDLRREITRLEDDIEALSVTIENCRKFTLAARVAVMLGGVLLLALLSGLIRFDPMLLVAAIAAVLGGIVLSGSNRTTAENAKAELAAAEEKRAALIGGIPLRVVH
jgi:uncharacterized protein YhaN